MSLHRVNQIREQTGGAGVTIGLNLLITDDGAVSGLRGMEFGADNAYDIGAVNRPRDVRVGRNLTVAGTVTGASFTQTLAGTAEAISIRNSSPASGYVGIKFGDDLSDINATIRQFTRGHATKAGHFQIGTETATEFTLQTAGTERMRIASGGQVLIGTTVTTGSSAGDLVLKRGGALRSANLAGTNTFGLITLDGNERTAIMANNDYLVIDSASTQTTVGAAGAASALPANPVGYLRFFIGGTAKIVPYYNG